MNQKVLRAVRVTSSSQRRRLRHMRSPNLVMSMLVAISTPCVSIADAPRTEKSLAKENAGAVDVGCRTDRSADLGGTIDRNALAKAYRCGRRAFRKISLKNAVFQGIQMPRSDFRGSDLEGADLSNCNLAATT